jgi:large subunit ribosomal protein L7Ae
MAVPKKEEKKVSAHENLFQSRKRNYKIGGHVQPQRDMTRYVKWPKYILLQRQRKILFNRLKVPAVINQFSFTMSADQQKGLFSLLKKYKPEDKKEKKDRLKKEAEDKINKKETEKKKPFFLKSGLSHVTTLVEQKKAKLVVIAADVDPIELVLWLPHLCRNKEVPYCIVKSKSALGQFVGLKKTCAVALTEVRAEDKKTLETIQEICLREYNSNKTNYQAVGNLVLGHKAQSKID